MFKMQQAESTIYKQHWPPNTLRRYDGTPKTYDMTRFTSGGIHLNMSSEVTKTASATVDGRNPANHLGCKKTCK